MSMHCNMHTHPPSTAQTAQRANASAWPCKDAHARLDVGRPTDAQAHNCAPMCMHGHTHAQNAMPVSTRMLCSHALRTNIFAASGPSDLIRVPRQPQTGDGCKDASKSMRPRQHLPCAPCVRPACTDARTMRMHTRTHMKHSGTPICTLVCATAANACKRDHAHYTSAGLE
jgi:hypothetical protein